MVKKKIVFLIGNGFSQGFHFSSMTELWDECLSPAHEGYKSLLDEAKQKFPLTYFQGKGLKEIELLFTVWKVYTEANVQYGYNNADSGRGCYENYIKNFCAILHKKFVENRTSLATLHRFVKKLLSEYQIVFVTTNYDLLIERLIEQCGSAYHFFKQRKNSIPIRKLHGSIGWFPLKSVSFRNRIKQDNPKLIFDNNRDYYVYDFSEFLLHPKSDVNTFASIYTQFSRDISKSDYAALIPPIVGKEYNTLFQAQAAHLAEDFRDFYKLIILGYSFPDSDPIIRDLILKVYKDSNKNGQEIICINSQAKVCEKIGGIFKSNNFRSIAEKWTIRRLEEICFGIPVLL